MRAFLLAALLATALLAGCTTPVAPPTPTEDPQPLTLPPHLFLHDGNATALDAWALPDLVADVLPLGVAAFEPTLGVDADGNIYYATTPENGVAVGFGPGVHLSQDDGVTWADVGPRLPTGQPAPPETNDPYVYVDAATGRVFQFAMAPILLCSTLSWSDDQGAAWTSNPKGCGASPPWDHQTIVAAAPRSPATTVGYPNVVVTCVNSVYAIMCAQSLDGGLVFGPAVPASADGGEPCSTTATVGETAIPGPASSLHGHLKASQDGVLYLPEVHCGLSRLHVSEDSGLTWTTRAVTERPVQEAPDPVVAVDANGTVHYAVVAQDGHLMLFTSTDHGATWGAPITATPFGVAATLPAMTTLEDGRVALAYPGTQDNTTGDDLASARWFAFVTLVTGAGTAAPRLETIRAGDGLDPLVIGPCGDGGRCPGMVDFIDATARNGTVYAAFVDACVEKCGAEGKDAGDNNASEAVLVRVKAGAAA
ncbi:MAG: hypothetical protein QOD77_902 [Thermoplasmata archaeon]|jgi:hypothetical protein|nr:hypothetical protein [Thermoplasmata archaeon]